MGQYRAFLREEFELGRVRLIVVDNTPLHSSILLEDGTWERVERGAEFPRNAGIPLDNSILPDVAEALMSHLGNAIPNVGEVTVLREALTYERERIDKFIIASVAKVRGD